MAPLCYTAKLDPFLSTDCAGVEGGGIKFCYLATLHADSQTARQNTLLVRSIVRSLDTAGLAMCGGDDDGGDKAAKGANCHGGIFRNMDERRAARPKEALDWN